MLSNIGCNLQLKDDLLSRYEIKYIPRRNSCLKLSSVSGWYERNISKCLIENLNGGLKIVGETKVTKAKEVLRPDPKNTNDAQIS